LTEETPVVGTHPFLDEPALIVKNGRIYRWEFERRGQSVNVDVPGQLTLDEDRLMIDAAIEGVGIAFVPERAAGEAIARRKLSVVLDDWCPRIPGVCLYYPGHRQDPSALRASIDVLKENSASESGRAMSHRSSTMRHRET
jgi:DNA-binding transcriptional LysR family regulator